MHNSQRRRASAGFRRAMRRTAIDDRETLDAIEAGIKGDVNAADDND